MRFEYCRTIRFGDTDAAGVVYFAAVLSICHEAYEASLATTGIELRQYFSRGGIAVPIVHAEANYFQPMYCGEVYRVQLRPQSLSESSFAIAYELYPEGDWERVTVRAETRHMAIDPNNRSRVPLPDSIQAWLMSWSDR
ncbi:thioesterase family protein [Synechococcus sp. PCC 7336]|uniref:acyl-CoA thioesterase n=1 Tax=Synechococcus sp. PCC 7336 TaxID=195250 RepID=UPI0003470E2E|nr:thioesterase family protein [Synechococcus sp. PCC 7336]